MNVERARIEKIPRWPRAHESFHSVTRAKRLGNLNRLLGIVVDIGAQAAARRENLAARFHLLDIDFVSAAPGHHQRVFAQAPSPAQRFGQVNAIRRDQSRDVIRGHRRLLDSECEAAERHPRCERAERSREKKPAPDENATRDDRQPRNCRVRRRLMWPSHHERDARRKRGCDPQCRELHSRRRSRVTASM